MRTTRLRVTLREVEPAVFRIVDVPATVTLHELHLLLQAALGWTDSHLHLFVTGDAEYGEPDGDVRDEAAVPLSWMPAAFAYHYDFGDGWEHDVVVVGPGDAQPGCRYGEGGCPPEDCGGPAGYADLLAVLAYPGHPDHTHFREWSGGLADFDRTAADLRLRRTVGAVPDSVRLLLDLTADGVRLTPGGRLPRALVRRVQEQRPGWYPLDRPAHVEEDLLALTALHDVLRRVGLLRMSKGVLRPTRAASDDVDVVRRLRTCFAGDPFGALLADLSVASLVTDGPQRRAAIAGRVHPLIGPYWTVGGDEPSTDDVHREISRLGAVLAGLDLVERDLDQWRPGPSALTLLPRVPTLVAARGG